MKRFLFCLLMLVFFNVQAATYYFSSISGDDNRTAAQAQNPLTPWKSIDKFNQVVRALSSGDVVLFKRNETFYGSLNISGPGFVDLHISIGAYGTGLKPVITGLEQVTSWTQLSPNIYENTCTDCQTKLNMVTFQDTLQPMGRWPKVTAPGAGYLVLNSHTGATSITSNDIGSAPSFVGGEVVIRPYGWILNRGRVTSQTSTTVTYNPFPSPRHLNYTYEPQNGYGFFFQNHINALTTLGDWMYDSSTKKIRVYFGAQNPSNYTVKAATAENLVNIDSTNYITFTDLSFVGANSNAFNIVKSSFITIDGCDIYFSGVDGIYTMGNAKNITLKNSTIQSTNNNGITANSSKNWVIQNNIFKNTGIIRGMGVPGDGQYNAISHTGGNTVIQYNEIKNTGYLGLDFEGDSVTVSNNFIDSFCVIKSDGGGIYNALETDKKNRKVVSNIVLNGIGDRYGRSQAEINNPFASNVHGIYMDGGTAEVIIDSNTVANCGNSGLELSSPKNVLVRNNTFYNNTATQIYYFESKGPISNLIVKNNIAFARKSDQLISIIAAASDDESAWGTIDSNYYCRPISEPQGVDTGGYSHSPTLFDYPDGGIIQAANYRFYSLDKWKILSGQDPHTKKTPISISDLNNIRFEYNPTNVPKTITLNTSYIDVKNQFYSSSVTLPPYSSIILLKSGASLLTQTISFTAIPTKTFGDAPFTISATATSGLPVSYRIVSGPATISGSTITITGAGSVQVEASQAGNATYYAAAPVIQTFTVLQAPQSINFPNISSKSQSDPPFTITATASSGLPVAFRIISGPATISGNVITLTGAGTVQVEASQPGNGNYLAANPVTRSFNVGQSSSGQTINFPAISNKTFGDVPFTLAATSTSGLPVSYRIVSGPATVSGNNITITGAGTVVVEASQAGDANYTAAVPVTQSFTVLQSPQSISFPAIPAKAPSDPPFTISASATSGLPVSFKIVSGPATISGNTVTITGTGTVVVEASQAGDANYLAAPPVSQSFNVVQNAQTISFGALPTKTFGDGPFAVNATASSGLPVSFRIVSGPATVAGNIISLTGAGTVVVEASQPGDANFNAATPVTQSFNVLQAAQTITFGALPPRAFGDVPFSISASANSGLPVSFKIISGPASISGNTITLTGTGTVTVEASQAGSANYLAANPVTQSFNVTQGSQSITFGSLPSKTFGDAPFTVNATASSGLPVSFNIVSGPATIVGNIVTLTGAGTVVIEASQAGNSNYSAATPVSRSFTVLQRSQTINFGSLPAKTFGDPPFTVSASATSGLPVSFRIVSGPATISGNTITLAGTGTVQVEASQAGDANYLAATPVTQSFLVNTGGGATCSATGTILREEWSNIFGVTIADIPLQLPPNRTSQISMLETVNTGSWMGARIRGYICAPLTGSYRFYISGDDFVELWLSTNSDPANKVKIAYHTGWTGYREWNKYATQKSGLINLQAGQSYYVEVLHKNGGGGDNVSVKWDLPDGSSEVPVAGSHLSPYSGSSTQLNQTITFSPISNKTFGDPAFAVSATASSGLPVSFRIVSGPASITGNTVTTNGVGTVVVEASQAGNTTYFPASPVTQSFNVLQAGQTINFSSIGTKTYGVAPFALSATASSGLPVTFKVVSGPATISGNIVTINGAGVVVVEASQAGNSNFSSAAVTQSFSVLPASQTITFAPISSKTYGDAPFAISATASSGLPVSFSIVSGPATISGNVVTLTGSGNVVIAATQAGNANYNAATPVSQGFTVYPAGSITCSGSGNILREEWDNVWGTAIVDIPLQTPPDKTSLITAVETINTGSWMGARIRGYICAPYTGNYTFYIAGDDYVELWLSSDNNPANKSRIAYHTYYTGFREWNKYATQKSVPKYMEAGKSYYVEVLHKNGGGGDNVSVKWDMPNGVTEVPIPGSRLSPFVGTSPAPNYLVTTNTGASRTAPLVTSATVSVFPNPVQQAATITIQTIDEGAARLDIYDQNGKLVLNVFKGNVQVGNQQTFKIETNKLTSGIYTIKLTTKSSITTRKMIVMH